MKNVIIGTAGHIDHGKTTLIRALTNRNTDTLPEEIRRGISINLGFTYFDLPSGKRAGIVDVPGHERFIKNMIAGACGIDIVLLTIAATEGVKPQTIEHADIISFLGIKDGLIVMTKCDIADDVMRELTSDDIREKLKGTFFEDKEIVMVDSVSGFGLDELIKKMDELAEKTEQKNIASSSRLNIDRVFTKKGFGAVVTGTLSEGKISLNDELCVYHYGKREATKVKVKNIQIHEENCPVAYAGQRTALNLAGIKASDIVRGDVLATEGSIIATTIADAQLRTTKSTNVSLKMWDRLRIYLGSKETFARFVPLSTFALQAPPLEVDLLADTLWEHDKDVLEPGESCFCQLRFEENVYIKKGDPFVIRRYSPMETIGGGEVLDPVPVKRRKATDEDINSLSVKLQGSDTDIVEEILKNAKEPADIKALATLSSQGTSQVEHALKSLISDSIVFEINGLYIHINTVEDYRIKMTEIIADFHNKFSLKPGMPKEELRSKAALPLKAKEFDSLLGVFCVDGTLKMSENIISLSIFEQKYTEAQQKIRDRIERAYLDAKFTPPPKSEIATDKASLEVFESMVKKVLIPLDDNIFLHISHIEAAKEMIREHIAKRGSLTLAEFRDMTNSSRKYCLLILEYFDNRNFTRREGESRVLRMGQVRGN